MASYTSKAPERLQDTRLRDERSNTLTSAFFEITFVFILSSQSDTGKYESLHCDPSSPNPAGLFYDLWVIYSS